MNFDLNRDKPNGMAALKTMKYLQRNSLITSDVFIDAANTLIQPV